MVKEVVKKQVQAAIVAKPPSQKESRSSFVNDSNCYSIEENDDLNSSNDSYMSSSDEEDDAIDSQGIQERCTFSAKKELTRTEKALITRRFDQYFLKA